MSRRRKRHSPEQIIRKLRDADARRERRLAELAEWLALQRGVRLPDPGLMATLNGRGWTQLPEGMDRTLASGDQVALFPVVGGG